MTIRETIGELWDKIRGKKEETNGIPPEWLGKQPLAPEEPKRKLKTPKLKRPKLGLKSKIPKFEPIRVPHLLKVKRVVAFILFVLFCFQIWASLQQFYWEGLLLTVPTALIILDYLYKTRGSKQKVKWFELEDMEEE